MVGVPALDGGTHCASVMAFTPVSCVVVSRESALAVLQHTPALALDVLKLALHRVRQATETTRRALFSDAYSRLVALLQNRHGNQMDGLCAPQQHPMTHAQIAQHIGCSREMVSRLLKDLEKGQYISRRKDHTLVLHPPLPVAW